MYCTIPVLLPMVLRTGIEKRLQIEPQKRPSSLHLNISVVLFLSVILTLGNGGNGPVLHMARVCGHAYN